MLQMIYFGNTPLCNDLSREFRKNSLFTLFKTKTVVCCAHTPFISTINIGEVLNPHLLHIVLVKMTEIRAAYIHHQRCTFSESIHSSCHTVSASIFSFHIVLFQHCFSNHGECLTRPTQYSSAKISLVELCSVKPYLSGRIFNTQNIHIEGKYSIRMLQKALQYACIKTLPGGG